MIPRSIDERNPALESAGNRPSTAIDPNPPTDVVGQVLAKLMTDYEKVTSLSNRLSPAAHHHHHTATSLSDESPKESRVE